MQVNEISMRGYKWNATKVTLHRILECYAVLHIGIGYIPRKLFAFYVRWLVCCYNAVWISNNANNMKETVLSKLFGKINAVEIVVIRNVCALEARERKAKFDVA